MRLPKPRQHRVPNFYQQAETLLTKCREILTERVEQFVESERDNFVRRIEDQDFPSFENTPLSPTWLARKLHEFGVEMQAGHSILSGSFIKMHPMAVGDTFVADFGALGQISFGVTE
jgi:hypothetical protein